MITDNCGQLMIAPSESIILGRRRDLARHFIAEGGTMSRNAAGSGTAETGRTRHAVVIGVSTFGGNAGESSPRWGTLAFAGDRTSAMAGTLAEFGYTHTAPDGPSLTGAALADGIWRAVREVGPDGVLVVHVLTHGYVSETGALYAVGIDGNRHESTEIGHWLRQIVDIPGAPMTLFLLDLCNSGTAARLSWQMSIAGGDNRAWVIAACGPDRAAFNGRFSEAVVNVLRDFAGRRIEIDPVLPYIPLTTIAREVRREVRRLADEQNALPQEVTGSVVDISAEPAELPFFPNPYYVGEAGARARPSVDRALDPFLKDLDEALDPWHFAERGGGQGPFDRGRILQGSFRGRRREVRLLSTWLDGKDEVRVRVVTGSPGVGKSALLGVLVCAAHPVLREPTQPIWDDIERPPDANVHLAAVHARQRSVEDLTLSLARQLTLDPAGIVAAIAARRVPPVIVIDALDEAIDPESVMSALLLPLARDVREDGRPVCRLLVAMRPWNEFAPLRDRAEEAGGLVDLDQVPAVQLRNDLEDYVSVLLRRQEPYDSVSYSGARQTFAVAVASALTSPDETGNRRAWGEFLVAGLYAHHFVAGYPPTRNLEEASELGQRVPVTLPELLELDLTVQSGVTRLRPVLAAVAHAKGDGMPVRLIERAARAFSGTDDPEPATGEEITAALAAARFYLHRTTDVDGTTLYRLFHQGLADHLRSQPIPGGGSLLDALLKPPFQWDLAEPYLLRHAGQHAADAGRAAKLIRDVEYLVYADAAAIAVLIDGHPWLSASDLAQVIETAGNSVQRRRHLLAQYAVRRMAPDAAAQLLNVRGGTPALWQPTWSSNATLPPDDVATAVACAPGGDLLGVGDNRGCLRVYRTSGELAAERRITGKPRLRELAYAHHAGRLVLVSLDEESRLQTWDGLTAEPIGPVLAAGCEGRDLNLLSYRGRLVASLTRTSGMERRIDLATGDTADSFGLDPQVTAVVSGRPVTLSAEADGTLWDDGEHTAGKDAGPVRCFHAGGRLTAAVGRQAEVTIWDVADHRVIEAIPLTDPVDDLAVTAGGDICVLAGGRLVFLRYRPSAPAARDTTTRPAPIRADRRSGVSIDLELAEAAFGTERTMPVHCAGPCPGCKGQSCDRCAGKGTVVTRRKVTMKIPSGVSDGMRLALSARDPDSGENFGKVDVEIRERPHEVIERHSDELCCRIDVPMTAAVLGTWLTVDMLKGTKLIQIRPGTKSRSTLRIAGKGVPHFDGTDRGDFVVRLRALTLTRPTDEEAAILRQIVRHRGDRPGVARTFRMEGSDAFVRVSLPIALAALGPEVTVPTPQGDVVVRIPGGTHDGSTIHLPGHGAQEPAGDLFVQVAVTAPNQPDDMTTGFMRQLAELREDSAAMLNAGAQVGIFARMWISFNRYYPK
jgi:DnaJ-class molecular chaperone